MIRIKHTVALLAVISLFASALRAEEFKFEYQKMVEVDKPIKLSLGYIGGNVFIDRGEGDRLIIDAVKTVRASNREEAEEVADHIEIKVSRSGENVSIKTSYLRMVNRSSSFWKKMLGTGEDSFGDVDFTITVPVSCQLEINGSVGNIEIRNNEGSIKIVTNAAGLIRVMDCSGPLDIICNTGDIELSSIQGELSIQNVVGVTRGEFLVGPITIRQPQGVIDLQWVEGDIKLKSQSCRIKIKQLRGAIDLVTSSGSVEIETELNSIKDYFVETTSGRIRFSVPTTSSGRLDIETRSGEIRTEVPIEISSMSRSRIKGAFGNGKTRISLLSSTGDVIIAQF